MRDFCSIDNTFTIKPSAATREWLARQLIAVVKLIEFTQKELVDNPHATPLFGQKRDILGRVVPEALHLSSYVNYGMAGIRLARLTGDLKGKFRFRTPKPQMAQFPEDHAQHAGQFYISGMPGGLLEVYSPQMLPDIQIVALTFTFDKEKREWQVSIHQKMANPTPRKPRRRSSVTY